MVDGSMGRKTNQRSYPLRECVQDRQETQPVNDKYFVRAIGLNLSWTDGLMKSGLRGVLNEQTIPIPGGAYGNGNDECNS